MSGHLTDETTQHRPVRVVLIDTDEIIRTGLQVVLSRHRDQVEVVGHVSPSGDLAGAVARLHPDVVLVHVGVQGSDALDLAGDLVERHPSVRVAILSEVTDERWLFDALRRGVTAYLSRSLDGSQLVDSIVRASGGTPVLDPSLATSLALRAAHSWDGYGWPGSWLGLSRRQSEVLRLLTEGLTNQGIADKLVVGEETVKTHLRHVYRKLGVDDRTQAVSFALRRGLFGPTHTLQGPSTSPD